MTVEVKNGMCRFCHAFCPMDVHIENDQVVKLIGDKNNPVYHGYSCIKGRNFHNWHTSDERLQTPLLRGANGELEATSLNSTLDKVANSLQDIIKANGPRSVAMYSGTFSHFCTAGVMTRHAFMDAIDSPMRFSNATIDQPGKPIAMAFHGRWGGGPEAFADSEVCMIVGANPLLSMWGGIPAFNPAKRLHDEKKRGLKLIVIDPRCSETARKADIHLQCLPGFDCDILAAMIHVILDESLQDSAFIAAETEGLEELRQAVSDFDPESVAMRADLKASDIVAAARLFAEAKSGNATGGTGSNMAAHGTLMEYLLLCLNTLCGRWVKAGETVANLGVLFRMFSGIARAEKPRPGFGFGEKLRLRDLGDTAAGLPTSALADEILTPGEGQVKALFVVGGNPLTAFPNREKVRKALESLELLVVIDPQLSATGELADAVFSPMFGFEIPAISFANEGMVTYGLSIGYQEPYGQYQPALIPPPRGAELIEDWRVFYELARRMQLPLSYRGTAYDMQTPPSTDDLIAAFVRRSPVPLDEVKAHPEGHIFKHRSARAEPREPQWPHRLQIAHPEMMDELAQVAATAQCSPSAPINGQLEMLLVSRREHSVYNSVGHRLPALQKKRPYNPAYINPNDARQLGVVDGDKISIRTELSAEQAIVEIEDAIRAGVVSISHAFPNSATQMNGNGTSTSALIDDTQHYDRFSGMPRMSAIPVSVTALASNS